MADGLKPCPWEKPGERHEVAIRRITEFNPATGKPELLCAEVECQACGATQRGFDTEEEAVAAWNARHERTCTKVPGKMHYGERRPKCSECGYGLGDDRWAFCPSCGAKVVSR